MLGLLFFNGLGSWPRKSLFSAGFGANPHRNRTHVGIEPSPSGDITRTTPFFFYKLAFETMISEKLSVPESVADFIEGRVPKKVGARHYTKLLRQADGHYIYRSCVFDQR